MILYRYEEMVRVHTKRICKVPSLHIAFCSFAVLFSSPDLAAETDAVHGQPIEAFQRDMLNQVNLHRRQACAKDLQMDEALHRTANLLAHERADGAQAPHSNNYN